MAHEQTVGDCIIEAVSRSPGCLLEELILDCPGLTWTQIFQEIARMSEEGRLILEGRALGFTSLIFRQASETLAGGSEEVVRGTYDAGNGSSESGSVHFGRRLGSHTSDSGYQLFVGLTRSSRS